MNLENLLVDNELIEYLEKKVKKIFFYRICGTGMGAAACLLQEAGYEISGADLSFSPPMSTYLESTGIECLALDEMTDEKLNDYDLIIVGNSVPRHSDYAKQIERCGVKFTSFPEIIGKAILKNKKVIGVAGTHGKTTTTYFMTQMLEKLNQKPGYLIGGILDDAPPSRLGEKYFVIESDEYDSAYFQKISKFRLYEINQLLLTSLEFDHADIFDTVEDIEAEFEEAFKGGIVSVTADATYPSIQKLAKKYASKNWQLYNDGKSPTIIEESSTKTIFSVQLGDETSTFETNVIGFHNILNITACIKLLYQEGFRTADLSQAVSTLGLVKRRQEYRGLYKDAVVIDDFAHHPRAISLTIDAIRQKYQDKNIITVFEPISATARSNIFQDEFTKSLMKSDEVILAQNLLQTTVKGKNNLDCDLIVKTVKENGKEAFCARDLSTLQSIIDQRIQKESVLLILSNRTCLGLWESEFVKNLK